MATKKRKLPAALQANADRMKAGEPLVNSAGKEVPAAPPFKPKRKK